MGYFRNPFSRDSSSIMGLLRPKVSRSFSLFFASNVADARLFVKDFAKKHDFECTNRVQTDTKIARKK